MIDPKDVHVYHSWTRVSNVIRVTHIPTGIHAQAEGGEGYWIVKDEAMRRLEEKFADTNSQATA